MDWQIDTVALWQAFCPAHGIYPFSACPGGDTVELFATCSAVIVPLLHSAEPMTTLEAATTPVGRRSMISFAKDGPDRKAAGCFRPKALGMTSLIILPEPTSSPLLTEMMGTSGGSTSCAAFIMIRPEEHVQCLPGPCTCKLPCSNKSALEQRGRQRAHSYAFQELATVLDRDGMNSILRALYRLYKACCGNHIIWKCVLLHAAQELVRLHFLQTLSLIEQVAGATWHRNELQVEMRSPSSIVS